MPQLNCGPFGAVEDQGRYFARTFVSLKDEWTNSEKADAMLQDATDTIEEAKRLHQLHGKIRIHRQDNSTLAVELECEDMAHAKGEAKRMQENLANLLGAQQVGDPLVVREKKKGFSHILVADLPDSEVVEGEYIVKMPIRLQGDWIGTVEGHDALERADAVLYKARHKGTIPLQLTTEVKKNELTVRIYCTSSANAIRHEEFLKKMIPEILHCSFADKSQSSRRGA